jgi:hypothetical protein
MATESKDRLNEVYSLILIGVVLIVFFAGYIAGSQKTDKKEKQ